MRLRLKMIGLVCLVWILVLPDTNAVQLYYLTDSLPPPEAIIQPEATSDSTESKSPLDIATDFFYGDDPLGLDKLIEGEMDPYVKVGLAFFALGTLFFLVALVFVFLIFSFDVAIFLFFMLLSVLFFLIAGVFAKKGLKRIKKNGKKGKAWAVFVMIGSLVPPLVPIIVFILVFGTLSYFGIDFF
jgi:uncharacterized membrane protein